MLSAASILLANYKCLKSKQFLLLSAYLKLSLSPSFDYPLQSTLYCWRPPVSLQPRTLYSVAEQTARITRAALPKGTLCLRIYDELGTIFEDQDFADLFPQRGQPAQSPFRLALITILQFLEGLSDRAAADAVRARIDWKYLLCLELDDAGFDYSVLCEFRARLLEGGAERRLFDKILSLLREPNTTTRI